MKDTDDKMKMLFLCHGNICRSPMAEFVMKELVRRAGRGDIEVESAALHTDEIGNDIHYGTRRKLQTEGIPFPSRCDVACLPRRVAEGRLPRTPHARSRALRGYIRHQGYSSRVHNADGG